MPMMPAEQPLTRFERAQIEQDIDKMRRFRDLVDYRKTMLLKALAGHTLRLWAEVLRLEAELIALSAKPEEKPVEAPAPMCQDPVSEERREA